MLESLPFLSAVAIAILENSRINSFAFWRNTGIRTAELIGLRPVAMPTVAGPSQPVASEIHPEAQLTAGGFLASGAREETLLTGRISDEIPLVPSGLFGGLPRY